MRRALLLAVLLAPAGAAAQSYPTPTLSQEHGANTLSYAPDAAVGTQLPFEWVMQFNGGPLISPGKTYGMHWRASNSHAVPTPAEGGLSSNYSDTFFDCNAGGAFWSGVTYCTYTSIASGGAPAGQSAKILVSPLFGTMSVNQLGTGVPPPNGVGGLNAYNGVLKASQPNINASGYATNLRAFTGIENDSNINAGASSFSHIGEFITLNPSHQNNGQGQDGAIVIQGAKTGVFWDSALVVGNVWGVTPGSPDDGGGGAAGSAGSTGVLFQPSLFPNYGGLVPMGDIVDARATNITDLAWGSPGAWIDGAGNAGVADIESPGAIASITPIQGHGYVDIPAIQIDAPLGAGTQAAAHVATMVADIAVPAIKRVYFTAAPRQGAGQATYTITSPGGIPSDLIAGAPMWGEGIAKNTTVAAVGGSTVTLSTVPTAVPAGRTLGSVEIVGASGIVAGSGCTGVNKWYSEAIPTGGGGYVAGHMLGKCNAGGIIDVRFTDPGYLFKTPPTLAFTAGGITGASATAVMGQWLSYAAQGNGCSVGDVLTMGNGTTVAVVSVIGPGGTLVTVPGTAGPVVGLGVPTAGSWASLPVGADGYPDPRVVPVSYAASGGGATPCNNVVVQMSWLPGTVTVDTPGSGYSRAVNVQAIDNYQGSHVSFKTLITGQDKITVGNGGFTFGVAAGHVGFYGATPAAKQTPVGACAGNTGCQALRDALGALGLINTGSISN